MRQRPAAVAAPPVNRQQLADDVPEAAEVAEPQQQFATLTRAPKTLNVLWAEWEFGVGGRKPAKDFTAQEQGADKREYSRRQIVWHTIAQLVRANHTADHAIDLIYTAYGNNKTVTDIIKLMRQDRM